MKHIVQALYEVLLGREPDAAGYSTAIAKMNTSNWALAASLCNGLIIGCSDMLNSWTEVVSLIMGSSEYKTKWLTGVPGNMTCIC